MSTIKQQYDARLKRVMDAAAVKEPDQVPIVPVFQAFPVNYGGGNIADSMKDFDHGAKAYDNFYKDFQPDLGWVRSQAHLGQYGRTVSGDPAG